MELNGQREKIDEINAEMNRLFSERMKLCASVAEYKKEHDLPVADRERERKIIHTAVNECGSGLEDYTRLFFGTMMELSRSYQRSLGSEGKELSDAIRASAVSTSPVFPRDATVACQGAEGAYSQIACDKLFPYSCILYFERFESVFTAVEKGLCRYGILPIENSSYGSVNEVYDLMKKHDFHIVRAVRLRISHALIAAKGASVGGIKEIYSHEQAIGQCSDFLAAHPGIKVNIVANTAVAAKLVAESGRNDIAAIASPSCAPIYGLSAIENGINNTQGNYTRFICISHDMEIYPGSDRISMMLTLPHVPGSLADLLMRFSSLGLDLTKLESRPIPGCDFEFMFYFDIAANPADERVRRLIGSLSAEYEQFTLLGCYTES